MKFTFFTDPSHGWIKVPKALLVKLGIADKITPYSYVRGDYVYLEEDLDWSIFANAFGINKIQIVNKNTNKASKIRSYKPYYPEGATKTVKNLMTGKDVVIPVDTPWCCNPASETYWSM